MTRLTDRRSAMLVAGLAAFAAVAGPASAQATEISGTIGFAGGAVIPKGGITIQLEVPQTEAAQEALVLAVESDGGSKSVDFSSIISTFTTSRNSRNCFFRRSSGLI